MKTLFTGIFAMWCLSSLAQTNQGIAISTNSPFLRTIVGVKLTKKDPIAKVDAYLQKRMATRGLHKNNSSGGIGLGMVNIGLSQAVSESPILSENLARFSQWGDTFNNYLASSSEISRSSDSAKVSLNYGIKPLDLAVYIGIGVEKNSKPIFRSELRVLGEDFQSPRIEFVNILPIDRHWNLSSGVSILSIDEEGMVSSLMLEYRLKDSAFGFLRFESSPYGSVVLVGGSIRF